MNTEHQYTASNSRKKHAETVEHDDSGWIFIPIVCKVWNVPQFVKHRSTHQNPNRPHRFRVKKLVTLGTPDASLGETVFIIDWKTRWIT